MIKPFSITDVGKVRKLNQDYVFTSEAAVGPLPNLFLLADGMGGHNAGDYASRNTVETVSETIQTQTHTFSRVKKGLRCIMPQSCSQKHSYVPIHLPHRAAIALLAVRHSQARTPILFL